MEIFLLIMMPIGVIALTVAAGIKILIFEDYPPTETTAEDRHTPMGGIKEDIKDLDEQIKFVEEMKKLEKEKKEKQKHLDFLYSEEKETIFMVTKYSYPFSREDINIMGAYYSREDALRDIRVMSVERRDRFDDRVEVIEMDLPKGMYNIKEVY